MSSAVLQARLPRRAARPRGRESRTGNIEHETPIGGDNACKNVLKRSAVSQRNICVQAERPCTELLQGVIEYNVRPCQAPKKRQKERPRYKDSTNSFPYAVFYIDLRTAHPHTQGRTRVSSGEGGRSIFWQKAPKDLVIVPCVKART